MDNQNPFVSAGNYSSAVAEPTVVVAPPTDKNKKAKTGVILVIISVLALGALVYGLGKFTGLFSKAAGEQCVPENISESNLTPNSVEIVFSTAGTCQVSVAYGTSQQPEALLLEVPEAMASLNHRFKLSPLLPSTTYYYQVKANGKAVGLIRNFLTLAAVSPQPTIAPTSGATSGGYSFADFQKYFGTATKAYDINNDGIVNFLDWEAYQKK